MRHPVRRTVAAVLGCGGLIAAAIPGATVTAAPVPTAKVVLVSTGVNPSQLPSWYHTPLSASELRGEVAVPKHPLDYTGRIKLTKDDFTTGAGAVTADASAAIGHVLIAGESIELPGNTLFGIDSHSPSASARKELSELKSALTYVTGATCEGYTDYGTPRTSTKDGALGESRAESVCSLLHAENPAIVTKATSYGESRPAVVGGTTHASRSVNRRVVIDITASTISVPAAPTITSATAGDGSATLVVTPASTTLAATSYQFSLDGGKVWQTLTATGAGAVTGEITGLTNGKTYEVIVREIDAAGTSLASVESSVAPFATTVAGAPTLESVTGGDGVATVVFAAPSSTSTDAPTGYEVSTDGGLTWTAVIVSGTSPYTVTVDDLTNGTSYTVEVRATNGAGAGTASNSIDVTPGLPGAPTMEGIGTSYVGPDYTISLDFVAPENDGGSAITGWEYIEGSDAAQTATNVQLDGSTYVATIDTDIPTCSEEEVIPFSVAAVNANGVGAWSAVEDDQLLSC